MRNSIAGLYDMDQGAKFQDPGKLYTPYIETFERNLHPATFRRVVKTMREAFDNSIGSPSGFTRMAKAVGHQSMEPVKFVEKIWDDTVLAFGNNTKMCNMALGALLRWTVAKYAVEMDEIWVCYRSADDQMKVDPLTGKIIEWTGYQRDNGTLEKDLASKSNKGRLDLSGLGDKWGASVR